jgi:hypothetical protein
MIALSRCDVTNITIKKKVVGFNPSILQTSTMVFKVAGASQSLLHERYCNRIDYHDADVSLAAFGRKEIEIAEVFFFLSSIGP